MMSDALTMTGWHTAVTDSLRDIEWVRFVGNYETICTQASGPEPRIEDKDWQTPALLVSVPGWDMAEGGGDGRLTVELDIELYVVFDRIPTDGKLTEAELLKGQNSQVKGDLDRAHSAAVMVSRLSTSALTVMSKASPVTSERSLPIGVWSMPFSPMNCGVPSRSRS
jgi:hypothetical protein